MITVYGDVLFAVNFLMDFLILRITGLIVGKARFLRCMAGALFGALYATAAFFLPMPTPLSVFLQLASALGMVALTFGIKSGFRTNTLAFLGISLFCGGVIFIIFLGGGAYIVNGTVYFSASIRKLFFSSIGCYYAFKVLGNVIDRIADRRFSRVNLTLYHNGKSLSCAALCDSGNSLHEPFTGLPVCILHREKYSQLCNDSDKIYVIPYKTVSGESHVMTGFKPDLVTLTDISGKSFNPLCIVAVTDTQINKGMEAIVSPCMLTGEKCNEQFNSTETLHTGTDSTAV